MVKMSMSRLVTLYDTALNTNNIGDEIVMQAITSHLKPLLDRSDVRRLSVHDYLYYFRHKAPKDSVAFACGTNLVGSRMILRGTWRMTPLDLLTMRNIVLLGIGWEDHMPKPDLPTQLFFRLALSKNYIHSVRDNYTRDQIAPYVPRVLNTACPTMWNLENSCPLVPHSRAENAVFSLNYHRALPVRDRALCELLLREYKQVFFWPQELGDIHYLQTLGFHESMPIIPPLLKVYDQILKETPVDVIGCRLHGGIRALQKNRRTLVLSVDDRASDLAQTTGLPTLPASAFEAIRSWITTPAPTQITLPQEAIGQWKAQFSL